MKPTLIFIFSSIFLSVAFAQTIPEETASKLASELAATLANIQTKEKYNSEPFSASDAKAIISDGRWNWQSTKGYGKGDLRVNVSFLIDGSDQKVDFSILSSEALSKSLLEP